MDYANFPMNSHRTHTIREARQYFARRRAGWGDGEHLCLAGRAVEIVQNGDCTRLELADETGALSVSVNGYCDGQEYLEGGFTQGQFYEFCGRMELDPEGEEILHAFDCRLLLRRRARREDDPVYEFYQEETGGAWFPELKDSLRLLWP